MSKVVRLEGSMEVRVEKKWFKKIKVKVQLPEKYNVIKCSLIQGQELDE